MLKIVNAFLVVAVLVSGYALYELEHATRGEERAIASNKRKIDESREAIKLLKAEWSSLTRPERIQKLASQHLQLEPTRAQQFVSMEDLRTKVPETVPIAIGVTGE